MSSLKESRRWWEYGRESRIEWTSEGEQKCVAEYVRRSRTLRNKRSAYVGTR
ncbi:MAG: hypothetical protein IIU39_01025 [Ruminococcus sp.]|nr:hypothetical protein [Ruminococcus sp.]